MSWAILDTNIYVGHWERGHFAEDISEVLRKHVVRHSSVVLSELRRGARTKAAAARVESLRENLAIEWSPTSTDWWEGGSLVKAIGDAAGWETTKRREFQNDALIALTARRHGATVVTANRDDFELLAERIGVRLIVPNA